MNFKELIYVLNPITENKYTRYKSRRIKWAFDEEGWYTGDQMKHTINLIFFEDGHDRRRIGYLDVDGDTVKAVYVHETTPFNIIRDLNDLLPDSIKVETYKP